MPNDTCSLGDGRPVVARGWCEKHYRAWQKYGNPLECRRIVGVDDRTRFEMRVDRSAGPDACHPWLGGMGKDSYGSARFGGTSRIAHIVAWEIVNGPVPDGMDLDHECHNLAVQTGTCLPGVCPHRLCCNDKHLVPKTKTEHNTGAANGRAILTAAQVLDIRAALANKTLTMVAAARMYNVCYGTIESIKYRKTWKYI